jgi:hypothetical protein
VLLSVLCQGRAIDLVIIAMVIPGQDGFDTIPALCTLVPVPKSLARAGMGPSLERRVTLPEVFLLA